MYAELESGSEGHDGARTVNVEASPRGPAGVELSRSGEDLDGARGLQQGELEGAKRPPLASAQAPVPLQPWTWPAKWWVAAALLAGLLALRLSAWIHPSGYRDRAARYEQAGICNASLPWPGPFPARRWDVPWEWQDKCKARANPQETAPRMPWLDINFCWVVLKDACHANLKAHLSWAQLRDISVNTGGVPTADSPFSPLGQPALCDVAVNGVPTGWTPEQLQAGHAWFDSHVGVYVLNLPFDVARWNTISGRLAKLGISAKRVSGVDMRAPGALQRAKDAGYIPQWYDFERVQQKVDDEDPEYGQLRGTIGCASGHFKLQSTIVEDAPLLAVAFEDDSNPSDDFKMRVWQLVTQELPCDWEAVSLMSRCPVGACVSPHLVRVQPDVNAPYERCHEGVNWGMHGVLYRVAALPDLQRRWKRAVFDMERPRCLDVDVALASISDQAGFYAVPAVQNPGLLQELNEGSSRYSINSAWTTTATSSTLTTTTLTTTTLTTTTVTTTTVTWTTPPVPGAPTTTATAAAGLWHWPL